MRLKLFLIFFTISAYSFSQQKIIDSLTLLIRTPISDSAKIKTYGDLCWYYGNISVDSAFYYGNLALGLSKKTTNIIGEAQAYNDIGILHYKQGEFDTSIQLYHKALNLREQLKDTLGMASLYNKLGISYHRIFKMDSALIYDNKALNIYKNKGHIRYVALIKNNIANVYRGLKQYHKALEIHLEVAQISKETNNNIGLINNYNNIANSYLDLQDTVKTVFYYKKAIKIGETYNLTRQLGTLYNNYASILKNNKRHSEALKMYKKSLSIRESAADKFGISSTTLNIGVLNLEIGNVSEAEKNIRKGLALALEINSKEAVLDGYQMMLSLYAYKKNTDSVMHYNNLYIQTQNSLYSERVTKEIADIQEKYNTIEREKEISLQKEELLKQELEIKNKTLFTIILGAGFLILGLITFGIYLYQTNKRKQLRTQLALKDELTKTKTQNKLQEERLRISRDLHDNIGSQLTFIISSIDNLKFLAKSSDEKLKIKLTTINNFAANTISQLRDTIWAMNKNEIPFEDFHSRLLALLEKAKLVKSSLQFDLNNSVKSNVIFSSVAGITIFRVLQEGLNNALKYADATQIKINLFEKNEDLIFSISDNGKGFDMNTVELGNGFENMQKRMDEVKGTLNIESTIKKGTTITMRIPKNT